ncbi:YitT family protein [Pediococcus argentinicus]|uniref:DUF2179 domain-containing protein n=1 Tax=Pediococcus argentinicus TaxID=480391 RepID=A0A0R2NK09_9LACO|nr:YitT family protein [Pediococcus argentinicus]KRO26129.1 hypothetical protein IV88_GL000589 [Pediococcus argentinicus]NKZ21662.1 YitT family protein [Pediococcus argentinicus]GEP18749.1 membrane protein [Pediococcus argentinicus]
MNRFAKATLPNQIIVAMIYGFSAAIAINLFLIPAGTYSSGVTGMAQLISAIGGLLHVNISISILVVVLNLPLLILAWFSISKRFTLLSIVSVVANAVFLKFIPVHQILDEKLAAVIFGGALIGAGVGLCFRYGFSTGGTDIILSIIGTRMGKNIGPINLIINGTILMIAGILFGWPAALYSLIGIFINGLIMDYVYIQQQKVTVTIFSKHLDDLSKYLSKTSRGATVMDGTGLYTGDPVKVIITVVSKYELNSLKGVVTSIDPNAFVSVSPVNQLWGKFAKTD